jgi:hypothetical protein
MVMARRVSARQTLFEIDYTAQLRAGKNKPSAAEPDLPGLHRSAVAGLCQHRRERRRER